MVSGDIFERCILDCLSWIHSIAQRSPLKKQASGFIRKWRMTTSKEVVPWKCHICRSEFDTPSGGICSRCNKATCREHLHQIGQMTKLDEKWVCDNCLTNEEKAKRRFQSHSILRLIVIAVIVLLAFGFLVDLFSGFYVLRQPNPFMQVLLVF